MSRLSPGFPLFSIPLTQATGMAIREDVRLSAIRSSTEGLYRTMMSQATISSALDLAAIFPDFKKNVFQAHMADGSAMRETFSQLQKESTQSFDFSIMAKGLAEQAAVNAETVISASVIVLAHSRADDAFTTACAIGIDLAPDDWKSELPSERKIRLDDLRNIGIEEVFRRELEHLKKSLARKSLPSRAEILFRHVPIKLHKDISNEEDGYYRGSKLEEADELRHAVVHGTTLPLISIRKSSAVSAFLHEAAYTALRSVAFAFHLAPDMKYLAELTKQK